MVCKIDRDEIQRQREVVLSPAALAIMRNPERMVFIKNRDLIYLAANQEFLKITCFHSEEELVGHTDFDAFQDQSMAEFYVREDRKYIEAGAPDFVMFTEPFTRGDGTSGTCQVQEYLLFDKKGEIIGIMGIVEDVSVGRSAMAVKEHYISSAYNTAIVREITQLIINSKDIGRMADSVLGFLGENFSISRAYVFEDDDTHRYSSISYEWCAEGIAPSINHLQQLSYDGNEKKILSMYDARGVIAVEDVTKLPENLMQALSRRGIRSMLRCAIYDSDVFVGCVGFDDCLGPRIWTEDVIGTLWMAARLLALIIVRERHKKYTWISEDYLAIGNIFAYSYRIDIRNRKYTEIKSISWLHDKIGYQGDVSDFMKAILLQVSEGFKKGLQEFLNLDDFAQRLGDQTFIAYEFLSIDNAWLRASLIPVSSDEDGGPIYVIIGILVIDKEKRLELQAQEAMKASLKLREQNMILDRAAVESNDFVAVLDVSSGMITLESGTWNKKKAMTSDGEKQISMATLLARTAASVTPNTKKKKFAEAFSISAISSALQSKTEYIMTFDFVVEGGEIRSKQYRFTWLDSEKQHILCVRTDITQAIEERRTIQADIEILRQAALDADDFVAVIDVREGNIELKNGTWFSRGVPTPEEMWKMSYPKLLSYIGKNFCVDKEEADEFTKIFSLSSVIPRLSQKGECLLLFNFLNTVTKKEIMRKQFRFAWLDNKKEQIIVSRTDITQSFEKDQQLIMDDLIIKKTALENVDFVAILDPKSGNIALRLGNWVTGIRTPESKKNIPYRDLLTMGSAYTSDEQEKKKFYEVFSVSSVTKRLQAEGEIIIYFDFQIPADNNLIHKKQLRYIWLDEQKNKILVTRTDITKSVAQEQKRNAELRDALESAQQASRAKSSFFSRMSHDIRTPMNAIIGFSTLLLQHSEDTERVRDEAKKILVSGNHLLGLINDVLDMSKIESGRLSISEDKFLLSEVLSMIDSIMRPQIEEKDQKFDIYVSDVKYEALVSDRNRLQQILINLLSNATKYTDKGGTITLRVRGLPQSSGHVENISFEVKDNGRGMSDAYQKILFTPFSREEQEGYREDQGTGLGLAITRNLVNMLGGTISVKSEVGKGSDFTVVLPFEIYNLEDETAFWKDHNLTHMLAVDDEQEVLDNIASSMANTGVRLSEARGGAQAVEMIKSAAERGDDFDIVLIDWLMPGMDGVETTKHIRNETSSDILIIILTAYDYTGIEEIAKEAGVDAFMQKPFFPYGLIRTVKDVESGRAEGETGQEGEAERDDDSLEGSHPDDVLKGISILAAEDNALNAEILSELLGHYGANVTVEPNGKATLERFERERPGTFDLILMDVQMPVMDGYQATRAIRALKRKDAAAIPIFAMTANAFNEDVQKCLLAGMNAHVAKPLDIDVLRKRVAEFIVKGR